MEILSNLHCSAVRNMEQEDAPNRSLSSMNEARRIGDGLDIIQHDTARNRYILNEDMATSFFIITIEAQILQVLEEEYRKEIARGRVSYIRRWTMEKLNMDQSDDPEKETVVDSSEKLSVTRQNLDQMETELYHRLTRLMATIRRCKDSLSSYKYFKSVIETFVKDFKKKSKEETIQAIMDQILGAKGLVGKSGSSGLSQKELEETQAQVIDIIYMFIDSIHLLVSIKNDPQLVNLDEAQLKRVELSIKSVIWSGETIPNTVAFKSLRYI